MYERDVYENCGQPRGASRVVAHGRPHTHAVDHAHPAEWIAAVVVLAVLVVAALWWTRGPVATLEVSRSVRVESGDTLWAIAAANRLPGHNTAETADIIRTINERQGSSLTAGEVLLVPVPAAHGDLVALR